MRARRFCLLALLAAWIGGVASPAFGQSQSAADVTGAVDHIGLTVKDLDASTEFFVDGLGWSLPGGDTDYPANFVTNGALFVTLWAVQDTANQRDFDRKAHVGLHHLAIRVASFDALDALYDRLKDWPGVRIEFAPELSYGGPAKHMMLYEPSGNRIEFIHRPRAARE